MIHWTEIDRIEGLLIAHRRAEGMEKFLQGLLADIPNSEGVEMVSIESGKAPGAYPANIDELPDNCYWLRLVSWIPRSYVSLGFDDLHRIYVRCDDDRFDVTPDVHGYFKTMGIVERYLRRALHS